MIYIQRGLKNAKLIKVDTKLSDFDYIANYNPKTIDIVSETTDGSKPVSDAIKSEQDYFFPGEIKEGTTRSDNNTIYKSLITIDIDPVMENGTFQKLNLEECADTIHSIFKPFRYILYATINSQPEYGRMRLIIEPEKPMNKQENQSTVQGVIQLLKDVNVDKTSATFSQVQGLPIDNGLGEDYLFIINDKGISFPVVNATVNEPVSRISHSSRRRDANLPEDEANEIILRYIEHNKDELMDRDNFLNALLVLVKATQDGEISLIQGQRYAQALAMGNEEWEINNLKHFKRELKSTKPHTKYTFIQKFKNTVVTLKQRLTNVGISMRKNLMDQWENNGCKGKQPTQLTIRNVTQIMLRECNFVLFDDQENIRLAVYREDEGLYTQNRLYIERLIYWLEPSLLSRSVSEVINNLRKEAKVRPKTKSRYLIPCNNGVFNLATKELESFSPKYVFTSKIATNYNPSAVEIDIDGWNIQNWLDSIACGDKEIVQLLWQVISASMNGNYSRKKSIWLLGDGNNGKGTFQELLFNLIGEENVGKLKLPQFKEEFSLVMLEEKVCCIGDDVPANVYIDDSSNFNSVVTGDYVIAARKGKDKYSVNFNMTVIQSTNDLPKLKNKTEGTYRRFLIVPFNADFNGQIENRKIRDEYVRRKDVLEFVLYKAIHLDFERFVEPEVSKELMKKYKQLNNPLVDFKENVFDEIGIPRIPVNILYTIYKRFCDENNFTPLSKIKFNKEFEKLLPEHWIKKVAKYPKNFEIYKLPYNVHFSEFDQGVSHRSFVDTSKDGY